MTANVSELPEPLSHDVSECARAMAVQHNHDIAVAKQRAIEKRLEALVNILRPDAAEIQRVVEADVDRQSIASEMPGAL